MKLQFIRKAWPVLLALVLLGCRAPVALTPPPTLSASPTPPPSGLTLPTGYAATVVVNGLRGPTQMILGPDQRLWVAQLAGAESDGKGEVISIDLQTGQKELLVGKLLKPVGIAVLNQFLWIAAQNDLLRAPLRADGRLGALETVLAALPFNGRSIGTLTVTPSDHLLYETSGARAGNEAAPGSATLWELDPAEPQNPRPLATGLKGAYAQTFDAAGRLWTTEIADDPVNGAAPPDELNWVVAGANFGWPKCFGAQEAALNYGGTAALCKQTRAPVAIFAPHTTPTSVVASPWETDTLLVALWAAGTVVRVPFKVQGDKASGTVMPFITGLQNAQHLLVMPDKSLLVSDFNGKIYRVVHQ